MVDHHVLLPHEIFGSFWDSGIFHRLLCPNGAPWQQLSSPIHEDTTSKPSPIKPLYIAFTLSMLAQVRDYWREQSSTAWFQNHPILSAALSAVRLIMVRGLLFVGFEL